MIKREPARFGSTSLPLVGLLAFLLLTACSGMLTPGPLPTATQTPTSASPSLPTMTPVTPPATPPAAPPPLCPPAASEAAWECRTHPKDWTRTCTAADATTWRCYEDRDYGFALAYPPEWQASISINTQTPSAGVIQRRHAFTGPMGAVEVDIWTPAHETLAAWLEEMQRTSPSLFPVREPNATVGGQPAALYITGAESPETMLTVVFTDGAHVYRFWRTMRCGEGELETLRRMLDTLRFSPEPLAAEIPDEVWQPVVNVCTGATTQPAETAPVAELPLLEDFAGRTKRFAWSPTGEALAYVAPDEAHEGALWLVTAPDFGSPQLLARPALSDPTWTPDGTQIAFVTRRLEDALGTVMLINADGTGTRDLFPGEEARTDPGAGFKAIEGWWDPEHLVVATHCGSGCRRPLTLDLAQQTWEVLFAPGQEGSSYAWSPDRSALVVTAGFNPQIGILPHLEDEISWLSGHGALDPDWATFWTFFADWSPDGTHVLFLHQPAESTEPPELWLWDVAGAEASFHLPGVVAAQWAPDGEQIAFLAWGVPDIAPEGRWSEVSVDPQGPNPLGVGLYHPATGEVVTFFAVGEVTLDSGNLASSPPTLAWSPEGSRLLYGDGTGRTWILAGNGGAPYELPAQGQPPGRGVRWSPDGRWLALPDGPVLRIYALADL